MVTMLTGQCWIIHIVYIYVMVQWGRKKVLIAFTVLCSTVHISLFITVCITWRLNGKALYGKRMYAENVLLQFHVHLLVFLFFMAERITWRLNGEAFYGKRMYAIYICLFVSLLITIWCWKHNYTKILE